MMLSAYFNATPLLLPKTGVSQYAWELLKQIRQMPDIHSHYFYLTGWSDELRITSEPQGPSRLWRFKNVLRDTFPPFLEFQHGVREQAFRRGIKKGEAGVYHELNFLPFASHLPTVTTIHDLSILKYPKTHPAARVRFMENRLASAVEKSECILTDSEFVRNEVIEYFGIAPDKVRSIALAAAESFKPQPAQKTSAVLSGYGLAGLEYVLAVGTLEPRKNLALAIRAYAQLPESLRKKTAMVIVGMRGWENTELDAVLRPLLAKGEVKVLGYVPDADLPALYTGASVFIYPSLYEGFGLPPLEAMSCGVPVIVSNSSSLPEVSGDAAWVVEPADVKGLADAIHVVLEDEGLRSKLCQLGYKRAAKFSWRKCAEETVSVYRSLVQ